MERMDRYNELVYPAWVKALIDYHAEGSTTEAPPEYPYDRDHKYLIFETQWGSFEDMEMGWADNSYITGHIPGAIHSNSDTYENGYPRWFLLPEEELKAAVGSMGITADTTVVVYSNSSIFAARLWWILKYAGVEDVRLLNGGYDDWAAAGFESETTINEPAPTTYDGELQPDFIATTDYVESVYDSGNAILADVRTWEEFIGEVSGYSYVVNKGRIPGAIYAFNADNPDREYLDDDGTLRSFTEVREMWRGIGIESMSGDAAFDGEVIFYCGSGYRSSLGFLYAYLMGYENARNYSDGWEGWSTNYIEDSTYVADEDLLPGSTDGWIQDPSGRPVESGAP
jgi:3-mercaptopyruvate sulfurtransferase SseA